MCRLPERTSTRPWWPPCPPLSTPCLTPHFKRCLGCLPGFCTGISSIVDRRPHCHSYQGMWGLPANGPTGAGPWIDPETKSHSRSEVSRRPGVQTRSPLLYPTRPLSACRPLPGGSVCQEHPPPFAGTAAGPQHPSSRPDCSSAGCAHRLARAQLCAMGLGSQLPQLLG